MIHNRDNIGQAFPRTRACRQDIVMPCPGSVDGIQLMLVKLEGFILAVILAFAKDAAAFGMQDIRCYKLIDGSAALKGRIELDQGIGPEDTFAQTFFDLVVDSVVFNLNEAAGVFSVVSGK